MLLAEAAPDPMSAACRAVRLLPSCGHTVQQLGWREQDKSFSHKLPGLCILASTFQSHCGIDICRMWQLLQPGILRLRADSAQRVPHGCPERQVDPLLAQPRCAGAGHEPGRSSWHLPPMCRPERWPAADAAICAGALSSCPCLCTVGACHAYMRSGWPYCMSN